MITRALRVPHTHMVRGVTALRPIPVRCGLLPMQLQAAPFATDATTTTTPTPAAKPVRSAAVGAGSMPLAPELVPGYDPNASSSSSPESSFGDSATRAPMIARVRRNRRMRLWLIALLTGSAAAATFYRLYMQEARLEVELSAVKSQLAAATDELQRATDRRRERREKMRQILDATDAPSTGQALTHSSTAGAAAISSPSVASAIVAAAVPPPTFLAAVMHDVRRAMRFEANDDSLRLAATLDEATQTAAKKPDSTQATKRGEAAPATGDWTGWRRQQRRREEACRKLTHMFLLMLYRSNDALEGRDATVPRRIRSPSDRRSSIFAGAGRAWLESSVCNTHTGVNSFHFNRIMYRHRSEQVRVHAVLQLSVGHRRRDRCCWS